MYSLSILRLTEPPYASYTIAGSMDNKVFSDHYKLKSPITMYIVHDKLQWNSCRIVGYNAAGLICLMYSFVFYVFVCVFSLLTVHSCVAR